MEEKFSKYIDTVINYIGCGKKIRKSDQGRPI